MTKYFDISRKIIANMTYAGWRSIPHVCIVYDANVGLLKDALQRHNSSCAAEEKITFNTAMLRLVVEGLKACPKMNGHARYHPWLVSGKVTYKDHIDISMPIQYGDGKMITVTLPQMENRSMREMQNMITELRAGIELTEMDRVLYQTGLLDTFTELRRGNVLTAAGRLIGAKLGRGRVRIPPRKEEHHEASLTPKDIQQGSITVSNMGSLYRNWHGNCTILEIIPPQLCALAIGAIQKRAVVDEADEIHAAQIVPITIAFDHRVLDCADIVPFMQQLDSLLADSVWLEDAIHA